MPVGYLKIVTGRCGVSVPVYKDDEYLMALLRMQQLREERDRDGTGVAPTLYGATSGE